MTIQIGSLIRLRGNEQLYAVLDFDFRARWAKVRNRRTGDETTVHLNDIYEIAPGWADSLSPHRETRRKGETA